MAEDLSDYNSKLALANLWLFEKNKLLILQALHQCTNHLCGADFINQLDIPKNLVSYHIKILREKGYVQEKPVGRQKNYQLHPDKLEEVENILQVVNLLPKKREEKHV